MTDTGSQNSTFSVTTGGQTASGITPAAVVEFKPITSQDDLNKVIQERVQRERAKYADYDDVKAKASRLDEIEAANKSEIEKANERAAAAEREREESKAEALRWRVAAKHGISDEDAELFLLGTDEATLTRQAERLTERVADRKKNGNRAPNEGKTPPSAGTDPVREFAHNLFGTANDS